MRVLQISSYDACGGASRAALRLHLGLLAQGFDSSFGVRRSFSDAPGVMLLAPGGHARLGSILRGISNRRAVNRNLSTQPAGHELFSHTQGRIRPQWRKILASADIINLHWVPELFDYNKFFAAVGMNQPVVWTLHDMNPFTGGCHYSDTCQRFQEACGACPQLGSGSEQDLSGKGFACKSRALERLADHQLTVVTPSRWLGRLSRQSSLFGRFAHHVIPYGLETDFFEPIDREEIRGKLGIADDERVLLMLALSQADQRKGTDLLQQALKRISGTERVCLLTIGTGVQWEGTRTVNLGEINSETELRAAYNAADLLIAPSREDNLPLTVLESMACGTPVVAFNIGGMPDVIEPGETGQLANPEDPQDLANCIEKMLSDPGLGNQVRTRCREVAEQSFALEVQAKHYIELYKKSR